MPYITILQDHTLIESRPLNDELIIGRATECGWSIGQSLISKQHLRIEKSANGWRAIDLQSTNGSWVDGRRITSHELNDGDVIAIGDLELIFTIDPYLSPAQGPGEAPGDDSQAIAESSSEVTAPAYTLGEAQPIPSPLLVPGGVGFATAQRFAGPLPGNNWEMLLASPTPSTAARSAVARYSWDHLKKKLRSDRTKKRASLILVASVGIVAILWFYGNIGESRHQIDPQAGNNAQTQSPSSPNTANLVDVPV